MHHRRPIAAAATVLLVLALASPAPAALLGRAAATAGGSDWQAYYDDTLDITWLADANYAQTSGYHPTGNMTWDAAVAFIDTLNDSALLGLTDWRLPYVYDVNADGCPGFSRLDVLGVDCGYYTAYNEYRAELSTLFYETLGNHAFYAMDGTYPNPAGYGARNVGPFTNLQTGGLYWYGQENVVAPLQAWYFGMPTGGQGPRGKNESAPAWAVVDGDPFAVVPLPATAWLFASALGLAGVLRRRMR